MPGEAVKGLSRLPVHALRYNATGNPRYESTYWLISFIKPGARVLDVGCGTGSITKTIKDTVDVDIVGIEPNRDRAQAARQLGLVVVNGFYSDDVVKKHGTFDYVLFADVLEHIEDPSALLTAVTTALKPDGRVIASVPNVAHWSIRLKLLFGSFNYEPSGLMDATHLRWFTKKSLIHLFKTSGYDVTDLYPSAGAWMQDYRHTPLGLLPLSLRALVLNKLGSLFHGLFACQHVLSARKM